MDPNLIIRTLEELDRAGKSHSLWKRRALLLAALLRETGREAEAKEIMEMEDPELEGLLGFYVHAGKVEDPGP